MKKKDIFPRAFSCFLFLLIFAMPPLFAIDESVESIDQPRVLTINICSYRNGVGLDQDIDIMVRELRTLGHIVGVVHYGDNNPRSKVDINIFIEVLNENLFQYADKNYYIPNPEWYCYGLHIIRRFDKILCKTKETERIFKQYNPNSVYMSFTCEDRYDPLIKKDYTLGLHLAGGSVQKNTGEVALAWQENPHFPMLTVIKHHHSWNMPPISNVALHYRYFSHKELVHYQNFHGLHICPSGMEGFGHYIMEGMGCGAVVITLDAPPMNEFVKDKRCLVKYSHARPHYLASMYHVEPSEIAVVVENILSLPEEELEEIGRKNREFYLENDRLFKEKLAEIFPPTIKLLTQD